MREDREYRAFAFGADINPHAFDISRQCVDGLSIRMRIADFHIQPFPYFSNTPFSFMSCRRCWRDFT